MFSERIETLRWLERQLTADFALKPRTGGTATWTMPDTDQQELVERFGRLEDPLRVLLCSDVASEGLNLHYFCHRLVHFDLPWSLMVFQQRNGRVDRYGQKHHPISFTCSPKRRSRNQGGLPDPGSTEKKDEQANFNLGDPASFLNVYDPDKEAEKVANFMAEGLSPEQVESRLDASLQQAAEMKKSVFSGEYEFLKRVSSVLNASASYTGCSFMFYIEARPEFELRADHEKRRVSQGLQPGVATRSRTRACSTPKRGAKRTVFRSATSSADFFTLVAQGCGVGRATGTHKPVAKRTSSRWLRSTAGCSTTGVMPLLNKVRFPNVCVATGRPAHV